jgi:hypothetical protein
MIDQTHAIEHGRQTAFASNVANRDLAKVCAGARLRGEHGVSKPAFFNGALAYDAE